MPGDPEGMRTSDLLAAITQEFREHEDLPNTTNPDDWARISGKKGERIVYVRTLLSNEDDDPSGGRSIEAVATDGSDKPLSSVVIQSAEVFVDPRLVDVDAGGREGVEAVAVGHVHVTGLLLTTFSRSR